jgi:hypothetical protein
MMVSISEAENVIWAFTGRQPKTATQSQKQVSRAKAGLGAGVERIFIVVL